jgi:hypothetical protein
MLIHNIVSLELKLENAKKLIFDTKNFVSRFVFCMVSNVVLQDPTTRLTKSSQGN